MSDRSAWNACTSCPVEVRRWRALPILLLLAIFSPSSLARGAAVDGPDFAAVEKVVRETFAEWPRHEADDIISRGQVALVLQRLEQLGWRVPGADGLLLRVLPDDDYLVQQLRTRHGRRFMSQVGSRKLMYDQLDRVARVEGGPALVRDLPKLPDAARQANHLEEFLPKIGSGRRRRVKDFDKATGRIYTVDQLVKTLHEIFDQTAA